LNKERNEMTAKYIWESWIVDSEENTEDTESNVDDSERQTCDS
tara:strand:- start:51 stop:179 length:129 start_codon:yes stop_codon:yes gene_type:complete